MGKSRAGAAEPLGTRPVRMRAGTSLQCNSCSCAGVTAGLLLPLHKAAVGKASLPGQGQSRQIWMAGWPGLGRAQRTLKGHSRTAWLDECAREPNKSQRICFDAAGDGEKRRPMREMTGHAAC